MAEIRGLLSFQYEPLQIMGRADGCLLSHSHTVNTAPIPIPSDLRWLPGVF